MKSSLLQKLTYEAEENTVNCARESVRAKAIRRIFSTFPPGRVLDIGCGDGSILSPLQGKHDIHGVDISTLAVKLAQAAGIQAQQHDLGAPLPFEDAFFDSVLCAETIEHQVDTDWILSEANRVLKPGGHLVLTYPNIRTPVGIFMLVFLDIPPMCAARYRAPHYRDFTLRTIKIALANNRFELVSASGCSFFLPYFGECGATLASVIPRFASTVVVLARKVGQAHYLMENSIGELFRYPRASSQ